MIFVMLEQTLCTSEICVNETRRSWTNWANLQQENGNFKFGISQLGFFAWAGQELVVLEQVLKTLVQSA